jgi:hypothetical protein
MEARIEFNEEEIKKTVDLPSDDNYIKEEQRHIKLEYKRELIGKLTQENYLRKLYTERIFLFTCLWVLIVMTIVFFNGLNCFNFILSDKIIITLITSTTLNIFGFFTLVVRYLFNPKHST